ncbi:MAG: SCP2 sterol-binding domain-containing protein [Promethearchaeota archaeon]|nr:MAG: SCP2 sterol-binding domain-containing protein [Candidatus Lokiarchaeota archaeon]
MMNKNTFNSVLKGVLEDNEKFASVIDRIIKAGVKLINSTEELKEELIGFEGIYQTYIEDANLNYWFKVSENQLEYQTGEHPEAPFKCYFKKQLFLKIMMRELSGTEEFLKGRLRVDGDLSQGLKYVKFHRLFFQYIQAKNGNNNH